MDRYSTYEPIFGIHRINGVAHLKLRICPSSIKKLKPDVFPRLWRRLKELAHVDNELDANREDCNEIDEDILR